MWAKPAFGEHVGIGPASRARISEPLRNAIEFALQSKRKLVVRLVGKAPSIPMVVSDAPHLRIFADLHSMLISVGPGERLRMIGRPVLWMAAAIWRISVGR